MAVDAGDVERARDFGFAGVTTFLALVSGFDFAGEAARVRALAAEDPAATDGAGGHGKNRLTRRWFSGYAAYLRELRASVTSSEAPAQSPWKSKK